MRTILTTVLLIATSLQATTSDDLPCAARQTQYGAVCVCNSSYCDTVERPPPLPRGHYYRYTTSADSPGFHRTTGVFDTVSVDNSTFLFNVNPTVKYQEIFGFGGAFTDAVGIVVDSLPTAVQERFIESYFSKKGIEYSMGRVPIGSTDFSTRLYTYDDVPDDKDLKHFSLAEEDFKYKIPLIKKAMEVSPHGIKLLGSSFSSPKWMKLSDTWKVAYLKQEYYDAWARYHVKFLNAYADEGIKFWSLTGGNEVMLDLICKGVLVIDNAAMPHNHVKWMRDHLGPHLAASNHTYIKVFILDDFRPFAQYWMSRFAMDRKAYQLVDGVAVHWYFDWSIKNDLYIKLADDFQKSHPDKHVLYTESSVNSIFSGEPLEPGSWKRGGFYIYSIIKNINLWTTGYMDWNIALDTTGGPNVNLPTDAAVIVDASSGEFYKNPIFYALGHFSKFIPPGSRRLDVQPNEYPETKKSNKRFPGSPTLLLGPFPPPELPKVVSCLATTNPDNSTTVVVFNSMDSDVTVTIVDSVMGKITATVTANSINTFVYWPTNILK